MSRPSCGHHVHAYRSVIFCLLSVFPSHLRPLNGQAKVRYCHNAVAMFRGVKESTYVQTIRTRDRARHVASRPICPHIHVLCMPACVPMSARPRSGSPHDDLHRSSRYVWRSGLDARFVLRRCAVRSRHDTNFFAPVYLLISTHRNCFYGDYAVSWSFGATI